MSAAEALDLMSESITQRRASAAEIAQEIQKALKGERGALVEAAKDAAAKVGAELSKKLVAKSIEAMDGYASNDLVKKLFGIAY